MTSEKAMRESVRSDDLMCSWYGLLVVRPNHVVLLVEPLNATDMTGAIKVAKAVMPDVCLIVVAEVGSGRIDISYRLLNGEWEAVKPPRDAVLQHARMVGVSA